MRKGTVNYQFVVQPEKAQERYFIIFLLLLYETLAIMCMVLTRKTVRRNRAVD